MARAIGPGKAWSLVLVLASFCKVALAQRADNEVSLDLIQLPPGFSISLYTNESVPSARTLAVSSGASEQSPGAVIVYVGSISFNYSQERPDDLGDGRVYALVDRSGDGSDVKVQTILSGLNEPSGVTWHGGSLFVAERDRTTRFDGVDEAVLAGQPLGPGLEIFSDTAPSDDSHKWHFIRVGPDGMLYMSRGAYCNVCLCHTFGNFSQCAINRIALDGTDGSAYATGMRNTVGFDWDDNGNLWATLNGRDNFVSTVDFQTSASAGSNISYEDKPDDTLVFLPANTPGLDFGYPFCYWEGNGDPALRSLGPGTIVPDLTLYLAGEEPGGVQGIGAYCADTANNRPPSQALGPHVAPLGMRFYKGNLFPPEYKNTIFVALHGSWDRDHGVGYSVMNLHVDPNTGATTAYTPFAEGWLENATAPLDHYTNTGAWGRPVDVETLPDGSLLVSDDYANTIYRITYSPPSGQSGAG